MKKRLLPIICAFTFMIGITSCKKNSTENIATPAGYFLKVTVNGQVLNSTSPIGAFGLDDQIGCDNTYTFSNQNIGQIENSSYFIQIDIRHRQTRSQFANSTTGVFSITTEDNTATQPFPLGIPCNLDLVVYIEDKSLTNKRTTLLPNSRVNNVTTISIASESTTEVKYDVSANFTCSFKNSANANITLSGTYKTFISVFK